MLARFFSVTEQEQEESRTLELGWLKRFIISQEIQIYPIIMVHTINILQDPTLDKELANP